MSHAGRSISRALAGLVLAAVVAGGAAGAGLRSARADEPGVLSKERWARLSEIEFAELKSAEDLFRKKTYKAARNAYEKFMNAHSKSEAATYCQLMMAECTRVGGKPNDAVSDFQFVIDLAPDTDDAKWARFRIAQCYKAAGNAEKALAALAEVWKENGAHPTAFHAGVEHAAILEAQKKFKDRVPVWQGIVDRFGTNRIDAKTYAAVASSLARARLEEANVDAAYALIVSVAKKGEADSDLIEMGSKVIRELGRDKDLLARRDALAATLVNKVMAWLKANPRRADHQALVTTCVGILLETGQADEAIRQAGEAKKIYAGAEWTYLQLTAMYTKLKKPEAAIAQAAEARRTHKDVDWSLDLYATLVLENGDTEQALAAWDLMKNRIVGLTKTSEALAAQGKLKEAVERRRKIAEIDTKEESAVHMWVAGKYAKAGKYDEAIKEYRIANTEPKNLYEIAECYSKWGKHKESIGQYGEIAAAFEPEAPNAVYMAALEHEKIGGKDTAIALLRRVCRTYPKSKAASSAHVRLQSKYGIDETLGGSQGEEKDK